MYRPPRRRCSRVPVLAADIAPLHKPNGVLVDANGMTVYTFDKDTRHGKSACTGQCAENWPPVKAGDAALAAAVRQPSRATTAASSSTYKGKPLYTFVKDKKPGDKERRQGARTCGTR